jgi:hypothetical protein
MEEGSPGTFAGRKRKAPRFKGELEKVGFRSGF